jgi:hypothetical protein
MDAKKTISEGKYIHYGYKFHKYEKNRKIYLVEYYRKWNSPYNLFQAIGYDAMVYIIKCLRNDIVALTNLCTAYPELGGVILRSIFEVDIAIDIKEYTPRRLRIKAHSRHNSSNRKKYYSILAIKRFHVDLREEMFDTIRKFDQCHQQIKYSIFCINKTRYAYQVNRERYSASNRYCPQYYSLLNNMLNMKSYHLIEYVVDYHLYSKLITEESTYIVDYRYTHTLNYRKELFRRWYLQTFVPYYHNPYSLRYYTHYFAPIYSRNINPISDEYYLGYTDTCKLLYTYQQPRLEQVMGRILRKNSYSSIYTSLSNHSLQPYINSAKYIGRLKALLLLGLDNVRYNIIYGDTDSLSCYANSLSCYANSLLISIIYENTYIQTELRKNKKQRRKCERRAYRKHQKIPKNATHNRNNVLYNRKCNRR